MVVLPKLVHLGYRVLGKTAGANQCLGSVSARHSRYLRGIYWGKTGVLSNPHLKCSLNKWVDRAIYPLQFHQEWRSGQGVTLPPPSTWSQAATWRSWCFGTVLLHLFNLSLPHFILLKLLVPSSPLPAFFYSLCLIHSFSYSNKLKKKKKKHYSWKH